MECQRYSVDVDAAVDVDAWSLKDPLEWKQENEEEILAWATPSEYPDDGAGFRHRYCRRFCLDPYCCCWVCA